MFLRLCREKSIKHYDIKIMELLYYNRICVELLCQITL